MTHGRTNQSGGTVYPATIVPGNNPGVTTTNCGAPSKIYVFIPFNTSGVADGTSIVTGASTTAARGASNINTATDCIVAVAFGNSGAYFLALSWTDFLVRYALITA